MKSRIRSPTVGICPQDQPMQKNQINRERSYAWILMYGIKAGNRKQEIDRQ